MVPRTFFSLHYTFKGSLVDPRLRALNEHIPIVRVPRAGGRLGCPSHPSEGARSGSTGPMWVPFPSFSSCAFCEQEKRPGCSPN